jgi:hypothetical protein
MIIFLLCLQAAIIIAAAIGGMWLCKQDQKILDEIKNKQATFLDDNNLSSGYMDIQLCEQPFVALS